MLLSLLQACSQHGNNFSAQKNTAKQEIIHILFIHLPRSTSYKRILLKISKVRDQYPYPQEICYLERILQDKKK